MGIQISFSYKEVDALGLVLGLDTESVFCGHCESCLDNSTETCTNRQTLLYVEVGTEGQSLWVHRDGDTLWCDANRWGSNREKILPILKRWAIEYIEG